MITICQRDAVSKRYARVWSLVLGPSEGTGLIVGRSGAKTVERSWRGGCRGFERSDTDLS